jgi:hypothetical protein
MGPSGCSSPGSGWSVGFKAAFPGNCRTRQSSRGPRIVTETRGSPWRRRCGPPRPERRGSLQRGSVLRPGPEPLSDPTHRLQRPADPLAKSASPPSPGQSPPPLRRPHPGSGPFARPIFSRNLCGNRRRTMTGQLNLSLSSVGTPILEIARFGRRGVARHKPPRCRTGTTQ